MYLEIVVVKDGSGVYNRAAFRQGRRLGVTKNTLKKVFFRVDHPGIEKYICELSKESSGFYPTLFDN